MSENDSDEGKRVGKGTAVITIGSILASLFIHELGHAIGLNLLGISATLLFEIRTAGPVLIVRSSSIPITTLELAFVIAAGPGLAAIVFALVGHIWRTECYLAAVYQTFCVPFELLTWMLGIQAVGEFSIYLWFFAIVAIPFIIITDRTFGRIVKETK